MTSQPAPAQPTLTLTGERTLPGIADERYWFARHVVAYSYAADLIRSARLATVLDAGCGEGYGLRMLAEAGATRVIGADLDPAVVSHVRATYGGPAIEAVCTELMDLPLGDGEVDATVSFQVIEHLHDIPGYLRSMRRVTRSGGLILIATPNRLTFTPGSDVPVNPFHTREFTATELEAELEAAGLDVRLLLGVHPGRLLRTLERAVRQPLPDLLTGAPPDRWPRWLRRVVHRVEPSWFGLKGADLDDSLDLLAVCRVTT